MEDERLDWAKMKYIRGFIVYVARTYQDMNPYLKGLHFNLDSKSPFRDKEGWQMQVYQLKIEDMDVKWEKLE